MTYTQNPCSGQTRTRAGFSKTCMNACRSVRFKTRPCNHGDVDGHNIGLPLRTACDGQIQSISFFFFKWWWEGEAWLLCCSPMSVSASNCQSPAIVDWPDCINIALSYYILLHIACKTVKYLNKSAAWPSRVHCTMQTSSVQSPYVWHRKG